MTQEKKKFDILREQEKDHRKKTILEAAEKILSEKSFKEFNMRDLAREVGLSPGSIYTYFPDKESLFAEVALKGFRQALEIFGEVVSSEDASLKTAANRYLTQIIEQYQSHRIVQQCIIDGMFKTDEAIDELMMITRQFFELIDKLINKAGPGGEENTRLYSHLFFAALNGIIFTFPKYPKQPKYETMKHVGLLGDLLADLIQSKAGSGTG